MKKEEDEFHLDEIRYSLFFKKMKQYEISIEFN
jgi:hypothetical protein